MAEMILGKVSTTTSSIDNINNNDNLEQQKQPIVALALALATASFVPIRITNYIGGEIFESLICSRYLDSDDMISLLQINGIIKSFPQIRQRYCKIHGTKLDLTYEDYSERRHHHQQQQERNRDPDSDRDNNDGNMNTTTTTTADNNNDARFFSWWLEHQAFISADNNGEELPSISPDCIDCRMARFHHEKKCPCCKTFWNHEDIVTCAGQCQKTACADACHDGISQCACNREDCHNDGMFCSDCFTGYFCEPCETMYDKKCMPPRVCDGDACGDLICNGCADEGQSDAYICDACSSFFCGGCQEYDWCSKCDKRFCETDTCRKTFYCEYCDQSICSDCDKSGGIDCSDCGVPSCSECEMVYHCKGGCDTLYCHRCRSGFDCGVCKAEYCGECRPKHNSCSSCDKEFCADCKEGSFVARFGWLCIDCNEEEEEEDACANCFLSEGDMDDVNLKKCSRCKTVKYCSRACQRDDWKEHRAVCNAATVTATSTSHEDEDVSKEMKGNK